MSEGIIFLWVVAGIVLVGIGIYAVSVYNTLIRLKKDCDKAWANIDVLLKQRSDELPKLIDAAREYMDYENETFQKVIQARQKAQKASSPKQEANADSKLKSALGDFFALAENYPELKTSEQFTELQQRIADIEDHIADRREYYNEATTYYNTRIEQIPYVFLANPLGYKERELFDVDEEDLEDVDISESFES